MKSLKILKRVWPMALSGVLIAGSAVAGVYGTVHFTKAPLGIPFTEAIEYESSIPNSTNDIINQWNSRTTYEPKIYNNIEEIIEDNDIVVEEETNNDFYTKFIGSQNLLRIPIESDLKDYILHYHNPYYSNNTIYYKDQLFNNNNDFVNALDKNMKEFFEGNEKNACYFSTKENSDRNFVARMRMNILYYIANSIPHGRVVNTSNYSEKMLGWTTKWGDNVGDLFPLSYLTAHEVGALGLALGVPEEYLFVSPFDDMLGKTDEDALGISYYEFDSAIMKLCNKDYGRTIDVLRSQQLYLLKELNLDKRIDTASHKLYIV